MAKKRIPVNHRLGKNLEYLRHDADLSQSGLALDLMTFQGIQLSRSAYAAYEEGRNEPSITILKAIADYYEVTMDELCYKNLEKTEKEKDEPIIPGQEMTHI